DDLVRWRSPQPRRLALVLRHHPSQQVRELAHPLHSRWRIRDGYVLTVGPADGGDRPHVVAIGTKQRARLERLILGPERREQPLQQLEARVGRTLPLPPLVDEAQAQDFLSLLARGLHTPSQAP